MFAPVETLCAAGCGMCFRKFYQRQPLLVEMGWAVYDVMTNINHGMGFCPLSASYLFILAGINVCHPMFLRTLSLKQILKHSLLSTLPFVMFSVFWRPFNFLILFLMRNFFGHSEYCDDVWLTALSYLSALFIFILSLLLTRRNKGIFGFAYRRQNKSHAVPAKVATFSASKGSMHRLRSSHEYRRTRSGCIYGYW